MPETDWYSPSWSGPSPQQPLPWGQLAAIDALNSAINLSVGTSPPSHTQSMQFPTDTSTSSPTSMQASHKSKNRAAIIGGTIGGLIFLALLGFLPFFVYRQRRRVLAPSKDDTFGIFHTEEHTPHLTERREFNDAHVHDRQRLSTLLSETGE